MPDTRQPPGSGGPANPGWYRDPWGRSAWRWWDGWQWTGWISPPENVSPAVVRQLVEPPPPFSAAEPEAPARERLPGGAPAGIAPAPIAPDPPPPPPAGAQPPGWREAPLGPPPRPVVQAAGPAEPVAPSARRRLVLELLVVLAIFPIPAAVSAWTQLAASAAGKGPGVRLPTLIGGHPGLSFPFLLLQVLLEMAGAALVLYLLSMPGGDGGPASIGLDRRNPRGDAALVLPVFLVCYVGAQLIVAQFLYAAHVRGVNPGLGHFPAYYEVIYVVSSLGAGIVEEIVVLGYFVRRLEQLGLRPAWVVIAAVALRGSYHLYYGWGVLPIIAWALASVLVYRRFRRLAPMIFVHAAWDIGIFMAQLHGNGSFGVEALLIGPASLVAFIAWRQYIPRKSSPLPPSGADRVGLR